LTAYGNLLSRSLLADPAMTVEEVRWLLLLKKSVVCNGQSMTGCVKIVLIEACVIIDMKIFSVVMKADYLLPACIPEISAY